MRRASIVLAAIAVASIARADATLPPWTDPSDVPLPSGARSVAPLREGTAIAAAPGRPDLHRGATFAGVRLPLYAAKRGAGCAGRWLEVGPMAWICGDAADVTNEAPGAPPLRHASDGLPFRYFFVGRDGAEAFLNFDRIGEEAPDVTLDPGFAVAVVEERQAVGETWGLTRHGKWIALHELSAVRASPFKGEVVDGGSAQGAGRSTPGTGALDFGWVIADSAPVYSAPNPRGKIRAARARFERVAWREERAAPSGGGLMVRVSDDGAKDEAWLRARDLAKPTLQAPPASAGEGEKWIDVDLAAQVLTAYDGATPVYATLVSTGKGAPDSETATPPGVHRIWVKLASHDMDNLDADPDDETSRYSIEDVPYVQFFDKGIALHGAFWHGDFGRPHSHGCVNLAPRDAEWLFAFTAPHLPAGWTAAYPTSLEPGTLVRVH